MFKQPSAPNLMASRRNSKRDSTRILSQLSGNSRVVPAGAKSASSRTKILASLTGLIVLVCAATWLMQRSGIPATTSSTTHRDVPTQRTPDTTAFVLPILSEPQVAQIENVSNTDDTSEKGVTPFVALSENATQVEKTNNAKLVEKNAKTDQEPSAKNTAKKGTPAPSPQKANEDADVTLLAALIQSTEPPASVKKTVPQKTPTVAERLKPRFSIRPPPLRGKADEH